MMSHEQLLGVVASEMCFKCSEGHRAQPHGVDDMGKKEFIHLRTESCSTGRLPGDPCNASGVYRAAESLGLEVV